MIGAYWDWELDTASPEKHHNTAIHQPLAPDLLQVYRDMGGRRLVVATKQNMPFVGLKEDQDGHLVAKSGIDVGIMGALSQQLNFTCVGEWEWVRVGIGMD